MLAILTYHSLDDSGSVISVAPGIFAEQMAGLAGAGYSAGSLRDAMEYRATFGAWPRDYLVLTFDDGYANFADAALPVLQDYDFSATVFVVSGHMGQFNDWAEAPAGLGRQRILSWAQAAELCAEGMEIGSHTRRHRSLTGLAPDEFAGEIAGSRRDIEDHLSVHVESFAYPFGHECLPAREILRAEYEAACTTELRRAGDDDLYRLPRIDMYYFRSEPDVVDLLHGRRDRWLAMRRLGRRVRSALTAPRFPARGGV